MHNCSEDVNELDVKPDGSWRVKGDAATRDLSQWHMPDGTLCDSKEDTNPGVVSVNEVKREGTSDGHRTLKLGIKKPLMDYGRLAVKQMIRKPVVRNHIQNKVAGQQELGPSITPLGLRLEVKSIYFLFL